MEDVHVLASVSCVDVVIHPDAVSVTVVYDVPNIRDRQVKVGSILLLAMAQATKLNVPFYVNSED